jgi:hypothetical protein
MEGGRGWGGRRDNTARGGNTAIATIFTRRGNDGGNGGGDDNDDRDGNSDSGNATT